MATSIETKPYLSDLDLFSEWKEHGINRCLQYADTRIRLRYFQEYLREIVRDTWSVDNVSVCDTCGYPGVDFTGTDGGGSVCDACLEEYEYCEQCEVYTYESHNHDEGCGCEAPAQSFTVRNDGSDPLPNDTRLTVTLPAGVISAEGMKAIHSYLYTQLIRADNSGSLAYDLDKVGNTWQAKSGNFTKRLSRHAYKEYGIKLAPEVMSEIGNIASSHSRETSVSIEVTRDLNMSAEDFYHEDSCWWGGYEESRCTLKSNGGFGLRSFSEDGYVTGRAWVLPLRQDGTSFAPTFNTSEPDALVVFNGYGDLSGYAAARILAHMYGWTYRKIGFECSPMYVNAGGYLIAPEVIADAWTDKRMHMSADQHSDLYSMEGARYAAAA